MRTRELAKLRRKSREKAARRKGRPEAPMDRMAAALGGECQVCEAAYETRQGRRKGFTVHHVWYVQGEKTYRDFKNVDKYHEYLEPIVQERLAAGGFALLCLRHHYAVEEGARWEPAKFRRYSWLVQLGQRGPPA